MISLFISVLPPRLVFCVSASPPPAVARAARGTGTRTARGGVHTVRGPLRHRARYESEETQRLHRCHTAFASSYESSCVAHALRLRGDEDEEEEEEEVESEDEGGRGRGSSDNFSFTS